MKYLLTNKQMREADLLTIQGGALASELMERAGFALAQEAEKLAPKGEILCLCGGGNNGGDGFVCARILQERGRKVCLVCSTQKRSEDCTQAEEKWKKAGGRVFSKIPERPFTLAVDCLYGTGFHGKISGEDEKNILFLNATKKEGLKILSADIPSGVNGENGAVEGVAVQADVTLCIGELKLGALLGDAIDYTGRWKRADIGIALPGAEYPFLIDAKGAQTWLPKRKRNSHKGSYGRAAVLAGSLEYTGAAYLSTAACLRSGVGYTTLFLPSALFPHYILKAPEALLRISNEGDRYAFNEEKMRELHDYDAVAFGMGMGVSNEVCLGALWLLERYGGKLILDADGLNSLAAYGKERFFQLLKGKKCSVLITPHVKEFSRLSGASVAEILQNPIAHAKAFAKEYGVTVLLKNALSIITDGERVAVNAAGTSGQAKGGSGDVLSGVIAGLCASGASALEGGGAGGYLVGLSAEIAEKTTGSYALTATDLISCLGKAFLRCAENADEDGDEE